MVDLEYTHTTRCPTCGRDVAAGTEHRCRRAPSLAEIEGAAASMIEYTGTLDGYELVMRPDVLAEFELLNFGMSEAGISERWLNLHGWKIRVRSDLRCGPGAYIMHRRNAYRPPAMREVRAGA
jgi:hypothetical protein